MVTPGRPAVDDDAMRRLRSLSLDILAHTVPGRPTDLDVYAPVDAACEIIETEIGISVWWGGVRDLESLPTAYACLRGAWSAVRFWADADKSGFDPGEKRIRRQRFFTFVAMAYELCTGERASLTWNPKWDPGWGPWDPEWNPEAAARVQGNFFKMALVCSMMLPPALHPKTDAALGMTLDRALNRRTVDRMPRKRRRRRKRKLLTSLAIWRG